METIKPFFKKQDIVIAVSSSDEYSPYLCVYLESLKENASKDKQYDIVIFERNISERNKKIILEYIQTKNISIRYFNPVSFFKNCMLYVSHDYFKEECYFRLAAPVIFKNYKKVIFTDLDLILCDDILNLGEIDLKTAPLAACIEPVWQELYLRNCRIYNTNIQNYTNKVLELPGSFEYFNTGVCIFDVDKYNKEEAFYNILNEIKTTKFLYQEQCALNKYFKGRFYKLPLIWNYELAPSLIKNELNFVFYNSYKKEEENAKIIHYLGRFKPWINPKEYKAEIWWQYARKTPFYEEILQRMVQFNVSSPGNMNNEIANIRSEIVNNQYNQKLLYTMKHMLYFNLKKYYYKCKGFVFGKNNEKYKKKYKIVKTLLKDANSLNKQLKRIRI